MITDLEKKELRFLRKLVESKFQPDVEEGNYCNSYYCPLCLNYAKNNIITHDRSCYWKKFKNIRHHKGDKLKEVNGYYKMVTIYEWEEIPSKGKIPPKKQKKKEVINHEDYDILNDFGYFDV